MSEIDVLIVPSLRNSSVKAADLLISSDYDVVFLNFPSNLQSLISEYVLSGITLQELISKIKLMKFIPDPAASWLYLNEPILEALQKLRRSVKVYCYRDVDYHHMLIEVAVKIASLTLKVNVTNKVDVKEWIRILKEYCKPKIMECEAEFVNFRAEKKSICITSLSGWKMARYLRKFGNKVRVRCVERLYFFKPLEILEALMEKGRLTCDLAENLIREHVEFIRNYVLTSRDPDEAYYLWVRKKRKIIRMADQISICPQT